MIHPDTPHEVHPVLHGFGRTDPSAKWDYITGRTPPSGMTCWTRFCRGRRDTHNGRVCAKCRRRMDRMNYPLREAFKTLRDNARRRKKPFDLTFQQFKDFAEKHGYMEGKGRESGCLHIDRKDPLKGYTYDNLTVLECTVNSAKGAIEDKLRHYNHQPCQPDLTLDPDYVGF